MASAVCHQETRLHAEQSASFKSTLQVDCVSVSWLPGASLLLSQCAGPMRECKNGGRRTTHCTGR